MLSISHVTKSFGSRRALDDVSLTVDKGVVYGLLGPNGAGKTTLIRIATGITMPDSGSAMLNGHNITLDDAISIGYMPEERGMYKKLTCADQIIYMARLKGLTAKQAYQQLDFWLNRFAIREWKYKKIEELSKGMAQKIQFIQTVIHQPELLILDEPLSGFDPVNAELIRNEIKRLNSEGTTVILSTHNMTSVEMLCQQISLIDHGKIVLQGNVNDIRQQHRTGRFRVSLQTENGIQQTEVIRQEGESNNRLVERLAHQGQILSFEEVMPSMEDIFINTVSKSATNPE